MKTLNNEVKLSFIELYLNFNYLEIMHKNILNQIKSYTTIYTEIENNKIKESIEDRKYSNYIIVDNEKIFIPNKPNLSDWSNSRDIFINGIKKSLYFIS